MGPSVPSGRPEQTTWWWREGKTQRSSSPRPPRVPLGSAVCLQQDYEPWMSYVHVQMSEFWQVAFWFPSLSLPGFRLAAITPCGFPNDDGGVRFCFSRAIVWNLCFAHPCSSERLGARVGAAAPSPRLPGFVVCLFS